MAISKGGWAKHFGAYTRERYKGKVWKVEATTSLPPYVNHLVVRVEFHIPTHEADEIEVYRRINKVIEVIAEGDNES